MFSSSISIHVGLMRPIKKHWTTAQKLAFTAVELALNQATDVAQMEYVRSTPLILKPTFT